MRGTAYLLADCRECGAPMRVRYRRSDNAPFLGCTGWPECRFATSYERALQPIYEEIRELKERLLRAEDDARFARDARPGPAPAFVSKAIREVIFAAHPDRWPEGAQALAHEVTARLNALRDKLR